MEDDVPSCLSVRKQGLGAGEGRPGRNGMLCDGGHTVRDQSRERESTSYINRGI